MSSKLPVHVLFVGGKGAVIVIESEAPIGNNLACTKVKENSKYKALKLTFRIYSLGKDMKPTPAQLKEARSTTEDLQSTSWFCNIL